MDPADLPALIDWDAPRFGVERGVVLEALYRHAPEAAQVLKRHGQIQAFALGRPGAQALQIGPVVAADQASARAVIASSLARRSGQPVMIDVPDRHSWLNAWLAELGFVVERPFIRMFRGENGAAGDVDCMFAISGPELG